MGLEEKVFFEKNDVLLISSYLLGVPLSIGIVQEFFSPEESENIYLRLIDDSRQIAEEVQKMPYLVGVLSDVSCSGYNKYLVIGKFDPESNELNIILEYRDYFNEFFDNTQHSQSF